MWVLAWKRVNDRGRPDEAVVYLRRSRDRLRQRTFNAMRLPRPFSSPEASHEADRGRCAHRLAKRLPPQYANDISLIYRQGGRPPGSGRTS